MTITRLAISAALLTLSSCGSDDTYPTDHRPADDAPGACVEAVAAAADVNELQDTHEDLWPAFAACADVGEFAAANEQYPDALDGADAATYVDNQCLYEEAVKRSPLCAALK